MRIVLWVDNHSNQKGLASKINEHFPIVGIIRESPLYKKKLTLKKVFEAVIEKAFLAKIANAWHGMMQYYENYKWPSVPTLDVENINSEQAYNFTNELKPDLVIVSGTRLIRALMLSTHPSIGILNLHTGLSPYVKGGPNCTNWCISTNQLHLIGNTVMWINDGIDTGNIITTELTSFTGKENLLEVHIRVMEHAHDLYVRAIEQIDKGIRPSVPQDSICRGTTYYNKQWGLKQKFRLVQNFKNFSRVNFIKEEQKKKGIITIPL